MRSSIGLIKSFLSLFGLILISGNELKERREALIKELKNNSLENRSGEIIKGEIAHINEILNKYELNGKDGYIPGI